MKNVGSTSTRKPVAHLLKATCAVRARHTPANLLASAFNLINDNLPHTVTPHNSQLIYITLGTWSPPLPPTPRA
eukprot:scaffold100026_cov33-Phaeocystis_antarctica.AAC.1